MRPLVALAPIILLFACNISSNQTSKAANASSVAGTSAPAGHIGDAAPPFSLARLDGGAVTSSALRGKVVLIDLWASWCAPCLKSLPAIAQLQKKYASKGLVVLAVTVDDDPAKLDAFLAKRPPGVTVVKPDAAFNRGYGTLLGLKDHLIVTPDKMIQANLPTWILIDRRGRIAAIHKSSDDEARMLAESAELSARTLS